MKTSFFVVCAIALLCSGCSSPKTEPSSLHTISDLSGTWSVSRPHREVITGQIKRLGDNRYEFSNLYNLDGTYEVWKDRLILLQPRNDNFRGLAWAIESPERLKVLLAPPITRVGNEYRGTIAEKISR